MEPISRKTNGRQLVNAQGAADICGVSAGTYQWYVRTGNPTGDPAPGHVARDLQTGQRLYPAKDIREWLKRRPGRGNWGGEGARARAGATDTPPRGRCPVCLRRLTLLTGGTIGAHKAGPAAGQDPEARAARCSGYGSKPLPEPEPTEDEVAEDTSEQDAEDEAVADAVYHETYGDPDPVEDEPAEPAAASS